MEVGERSARIIPRRMVLSLGRVHSFLDADSVWATRGESVRGVNCPLESFSQIRTLLEVSEKPVGE